MQKGCTTLENKIRFIETSASHPHSSCHHFPCTSLRLLLLTGQGGNTMVSTALPIGACLGRLEQLSWLQLPTCPQVQATAAAVMGRSPSFCHPLTPGTCGQRAKRTLPIDSPCPTPGHALPLAKRNIIVPTATLPPHPLLSGLGVSNTGGVLWFLPHLLASGSPPLTSKDNASGPSPLLELAIAELYNSSSRVNLSGA